jgi:hypothetical protein
MLSGLIRDTADCYRRAAEAKALSHLATNDRDCRFYLAREQEWLNLAQTYEFSERRRLGLEHRGAVTVTRACPLSQKATPFHHDVCVYQLSIGF